MLPASDWHATMPRHVGQFCGVSGLVVRVWGFGVLGLGFLFFFGVYRVWELMGFGV